tara:strand:+ start:125 stop:1060 length:936 start_codon:yes stop_codon:yes gene_type:complete
MIVLSFDVGIVNMSYCKLDSDTKTILKWEVFSLVNSTDVENTKDIVRQLDKRGSVLENVDVVLIEKQPKINPKMKAIASALRGYLVVRGLVDKQFNFAIIDYSPVHKLKCWDGPIPIIDVKSDHYRRKKLAIFQCEKLICDQSDETKELYKNAQNKKDDLADCYLQALSYVMFDDMRHGKVTDIIQRRPTKKQMKFSKFSKSNMKYFVQEFLKERHQEAPTPESVSLDTLIDIFFEENPKLTKNVKRIYGTEIDKFFKHEMVTKKWEDQKFLRINTKTKKGKASILKRKKEEMLTEKITPDTDEFETNTDN